ncbi:MAG: aldehyde dehydrogenase family protein [Segniliparus sp.]|uniref:aldehyde dehydrogenase family protein n=1 Tax=Segniliparus sp. TaxID=2804064 RepID=UPI003F2EBFA6
MTTATAHPNGTTKEAAPDARSVVAGLRATFDSGRTRDVEWRLRQLEALDRLLSENEEAIAAALKQDLGRDAYSSWLIEILSVNMDNSYVRKHLRAWAKPQKSAPPLSFRGLSSMSYQPTPKGVVLVISPWNYPVFLSIAPLVSALAAGNTVVIKPSELTPASARLLAELVPKYVDPTAVAVVEGGPEETQTLIDQGLDHIFFTGSERVGKLVARSAAEHLTPVTLELGGKCPVIVARDANVAVAARRVAATKLVNVGQTCVAPDYLLVERPVLEEFTAKLVAEIKKQRVDAGQPVRVIHRKHAEHIARLVATSGGEHVLPGSVDTETLKVEPAVVLNPDLDSPLMREEIFGPILPIIPVDSIAEAIAFVRSRPRPLAAYVFTASSAVERQVIAETLSGAVVVNQAVFHCAIPSLPFGGVGASGYGSSRGKFGFDEFSQKRALMSMRTTPDLPLLYPPFTKAKRWLARAMIR